MLSSSAWLLCVQQPPIHRHIWTVITCGLLPHAYFEVSDGISHTLASDRPLVAGRWYLVAVSIDPDEGELTLYQLIKEKGLELEKQNSIVSSHLDVSLSKLDAEFLIAGCAALDEDNDLLISQIYNGKIDSVQLHDAALDLPSIEASVLSPQQRTLVAAWDFSQKIESDEVIDVSDNYHHGRTNNLPPRAVKGWQHAGTEMNWPHRPGAMACMWGRMTPRVPKPAKSLAMTPSLE